MIIQSTLCVIGLSVWTVVYGAIGQLPLACEFQDVGTMRTACASISALTKYRKLLDELAQRFEYTFHSDREVYNMFLRSYGHTETPFHRYICCHVILLLATDIVQRVSAVPLDVQLADLISSIAGLSTRANLSQKKMQTWKKYVYTGGILVVVLLGYLLWLLLNKTYTWQITPEVSISNEQDGEETVVCEIQNNVATKASDEPVVIDESSRCAGVETSDELEDFGELSKQSRCVSSTVFPNGIQADTSEFLSMGSVLQTLWDHRGTIRVWLESGRLLSGMIRDAVFVYDTALGDRRKNEIAPTAAAGERVCGPAVVVSTQPMRHIGSFALNGPRSFIEQLRKQVGKK